MNTLDQPITIAVVGTHSTGKSTFLARLAHELRRTGLQVSTVADLGDSLKAANTLVPDFSFRMAIRNFGSGSVNATPSGGLRDPPDVSNGRFPST